MTTAHTMENQAPTALQKQLILRFISGKYQGQEFTLDAQREVVIGRASDLALVLVEDMVSRKHARIECSGDAIVIEDLGSTNGTFVNGEKISRATLKEGDRILIGTSILKLIAVDANEIATRRREQGTSDPRNAQTRSMTGSIEEIPLPDLMQLFGSSKKTGVLAVRCQDDIGKLFLHKGVIVFASLNDLEEIPPLKCAFRILSWTEGSFELMPAEHKERENAIELSVQEFLMEGLRQSDELNAVLDELPPLEAKLVPERPLKPPLRALGPVDLDVFQLAYNHETLAAILNKSPETDLDAGKSVRRLLEGGYLRVSPTG